MRVACIGCVVDGEFGWVVPPELPAEESTFVEELCRRAAMEPERRENGDFRPPGMDVAASISAGQEPLQFFASCVSPVTATGELWVLAVLDRRPRRLTPEQRNGLQTIREQILLRREQRHHSTSLARTTAELQRLEAVRRQQETFFQTLVESLPQNIFRKDLEGRFTFANGRYCATLGKAQEDILGRTDADFAPPELAAKYRADDTRVLTTLQPVEAVEKNISHDGSTHWVHVIKTPILDEEGSPVGIQGIFWDVTREHETAEKLQQAEANYRGIVENARDGIFQTTPGGHYLSANRALARPTLRVSLHDEYWRARS